MGLHSERRPPGGLESFGTVFTENCAVCHGENTPSRQDQGKELLIENLARIRDVEVGPGGEIYLLLEHASGGQIVRVVRADRQVAATNQQSEFSATW